MFKCEYQQYKNNKHIYCKKIKGDIPLRICDMCRNGSYADNVIKEWEKWNNRTEEEKQTIINKYKKKKCSGCKRKKKQNK